MRRFVIASVIAIWASAAVAVGVDELVLEDPAQEALARDIMKEVRCLVCQNQSIEDSDADLARDLRLIVRERIAAGDNEQGVKDYLLARYGDWILLRPPFNARMMLLWLAPAFILIAGGIIVYRRGRKGVSGPLDPLSAEEEARLKAILDAEDKK